MNGNVKVYGGSERSMKGLYRRERLVGRQVEVEEEGAERIMVIRERRRIRLTSFSPILEVARCTRASLVTSHSHSPNTTNAIFCCFRILENKA